MDPHSYAQQVMAALADRLRSTVPAPLDTPFGVLLEPTRGLYAVGERVSAPGLDTCSPRVVCDVELVGLRADHPGVWYLLRVVDPPGGHALMQEGDLRPVSVASLPGCSDLPSMQPPTGRIYAAGRSVRSISDIHARPAPSTARSQRGAPVRMHHQSRPGAPR